MYLRAHPALRKRSILFLPLSDRATARWCDAAGTPRDHPSQGHGSSPAAFHQMPRCTADERASIVPGHLSSPFRQSFDAELLAVPAPERGLAAAASSSSTLGTGCSSWSTGCFHWFLFLLVGVVLNRRLQIAGIVRCVGGSHRCTPLVARDGLGLLVASSRRRAELLLTAGVGRPELATPTRRGGAS